MRSPAVTMTTKTDCIVAVFAKAPRPGEVKTRLIPLLGAEGAATLHRRLLEHTLAVARSAAIGPVELWCSPTTQDPFLREVAALQAAPLLAQGDGNLGERMDRAFQRMLARTPRCVLIGSDCPALTAQDLQDAASALAGTDCDAVFIPAEDGGYVLVGLDRPQTRLFDDIPWGTDKVMQTTRARLAELRLRCCELPARWDVDRPEDYLRLVREMPAFSTSPVHNS